MFQSYGFAGLQELAATATSPTGLGPMADDGPYRVLRRDPRIPASPDH